MIKQDLTKCQDKSGADRYTTEVVVSGFNGTLQMLDRRDGPGMGGAPQAGGQQAPNAPRAQAPAQDPITPVDNGFDDDIPF